jgi:predicted small integral membrane protein
MENLAWMAWTPATACFFAAIALVLLVMIGLARARPETERVGILGIATTRGDRLFLSLVLAAVIHLTWIGLVGAAPLAILPVGGGIELSSLWLATVISLVAAAFVFRTV